MAQPEASVRFIRAKNADGPDSDHIIEVVDGMRIQCGLGAGKCCLSLSLENITDTEAKVFGSCSSPGCPDPTLVNEAVLKAPQKHHGAIIDRNMYRPQ